MPYRRVGDADRLSTTVKNLAGALDDPGDIFLKMRDPARLVTTYDYNPGPIVRDGLGQFHFDVANLTTLGDYASLWKTTGANTGVQRQPKYFTLVDEFTPLLLTFDEAKSQLNITGTPDADLERYVDAACTEVEQSLGQPVVPKVVTREATVMPNGRLKLPHRWIVPGSITAATQNGVAVTTTAWQLAEPGGEVSGVTAPWGTILVTYTAGFDPIPDPLRDAAALRVQHAMESQRGPAELPLAEAAEGGGGSFGLLLDAQRKEALYKLPGTA